MHAGFSDVFKIHRNIPEKHHHTILHAEEPGVVDINSETTQMYTIFKTHHSHTRRLLSSDVLTNRRFSSTNVIVLTAPRCLSYSCTTSPERISHYTTTQHYCKSLLFTTVTTVYNTHNSGLPGRSFCPTSLPQTGSVCLHLG